MVQEILFCLTLIGLQITAKKMTDIIDELADLMKERNVDLAKAYELINGGKISKGIKKEINWFALKEEFINEDCFDSSEQYFLCKFNFLKKLIYFYRFI